MSDEWEGLTPPYRTLVVDPPWLYKRERGPHSVKPPAFLDIVEKVSPGPYAELFARAPRFGWSAWGKGYESARSA